MKKINTAADKQKKEVVIKAVPIVSGLAMGPAFPLRRRKATEDEQSYKVTDPEKEIERFRLACLETRSQLGRTRDLTATMQGDNYSDIFESQIAILNDTIFLQEIENLIRTKKIATIKAVSAVFKEKKEYFLAMENQYFRDRAFDIEDLKDKILQSLLGIGDTYQLAVPSVIFAETLSPSDTINFSREMILGFVTDTGGTTSHAAIIARSLSIPYIINNHNLSRLVKPNDAVILDGNQGKIILNPTQESIKINRDQHQKNISSQRSLVRESKKEARTRDGCLIEVLANVEFVHELENVEKVGAAGIGLLRTEGIFLEKNHLPDEEEQYKIYRAYSQSMGKRPVILRTLDVGGDKLISLQMKYEELNPSLGWRAIRFCLDMPHIFKTQLRAILRANIHKNIKILIPMISCLEELDQTKKMLKEIKKELAEENAEFSDDTEIGIMIETPAAALLSDVFAKEVDFMSIGTNDLTQYTLAVDRTNLKISKLFNAMHPSILRLMQNTIANARSNDVKLNLCGELAGNPEAIAVLLGMGLRTLSLSPSLIPSIKKVIRCLDLNECEKLVTDLMKMNTAPEINARVTRFYRKYVTTSKPLIQGEK